MDLGLRGVGALVTGGSRGIGRATAGTLAGEGAAVVLLGRDRAALKAASAEVGAAGIVSADTTDDSAVRRAVDEAAGLVGGLEVVINCAAPRALPGQVPGLAGLDDEDFLRQLDTKALGYLRVARAAAPYLRAAGGGAIVNVSGMNARATGSITGSVRNIAVVALTKNLADELGRDDIAVSCVHPGLTVTERTVTDPEFERAASENALGRPVTAAQVADVITFLASPRGRIANGAIVTVDGSRVGSLWT